jgi:hypothetical protein
MRKFYDAHCHMMNLSHPNLSVMIRRFLKELTIFKRLLICLGTILFALPVIGKIIIKCLKTDNRIMNLMGIMESETGDFIRQMEENLRKNSGAEWRGLVIADENETRTYEKIVLNPLIMDFGLKNYGKSKTTYQVRWKPITSQVLDLCLGIKNYYLYRQNHALPGSNSNIPLFEILPFMGIDTKNYVLDNPNGDSIDLKKLLTKYFNGFAADTTQSRYSNLSKRDWTKFNGDFDTIGAYDFIGIKVYPPLGFNPYPIESWEPDRAKEMEKVKYLYKFCEENKIPITAHCSSGGFLVDDKFSEFSNPEKWEMVLKEFPDLRLDLAHYGAKDKEWRNKITELILNYPNVYTDISYRGVDIKYYDELRKYLDGFENSKREKIMDKIIFGSDFMINLMAIDSYEPYMNYFSQTKAFSINEKEKFCSINPEKYLYIN